MNEYVLLRLTQQTRDVCFMDSVNTYLKEKKKENLELVNEVIETLRPSVKIKEDMLLRAISSDSIELSKLILNSGIKHDYGENKAFRLALIRGQHEIVRLFLKKGASLKEDDRDIINYNIIKGRKEVLEVLKEYGVEI